MSGNQNKFDQLMNQGHSAAWDGDWDKAAEYYRLALQSRPDDPGALNSLGLALYQLCDYNNALAYYQRAARLAPNDPAPVEKISQIYERQGRIRNAVQAGMQAAELHLRARDVEKSIAGWIRVLGLDPENQTAHTRLALIYEKLGRHKEAIMEYIAVASLLQRKNAAEKAYQVLRHCLQLVPGSIEAQQAMSLVKSGQRLPKPSRPRGGTGSMEPKKAQELPAASASSEQTDPVTEAVNLALSQLAGLLFEQDESPVPAQAAGRRKTLDALTNGGTEAVSENGNRTRVLLHLGQAIDSQSQEEFAQAAIELEKAMEIGLNRPAAFFDLGLLLAESDPPKALRNLQKAVKHPDYALAAYLLMAQIHTAGEDYAEAANNYLQALRMADTATVAPEQRNDLHQLYEPLIEAQARETDLEKHKRLCDTIAEQLLRPDWRKYLQMARSQLEGQNQAAHPVPLAEMLLESRSSQVIEALATIRRISAQGMLRSAMEEAFFALQFAPTYLPLHVQIGELLLLEGHTQAAVDKFLLVAELYSLRGEAATAIQLLTRIAEIAPMDQKVREKLIELLVDRGQMDQAIEQYFQLAEAHYRQAELGQARQVYQAALNLAKQSPEARRWSLEILQKIADIDLQQLDFRQAARVYYQIRTLQPENAAARARLIDLYFRLGQEGEALNEVNDYLSLLESTHKRSQAIEFMRAQIEAQPDKIELRRRLADLYRSDQQIDKAVEQLDAIADALLTAGNTAGARRTVEMIISLNPPNVSDYQTILNELPPG